MGSQPAFPGRGMYLSVVDREKFKNEAMKAYQSVLPDPNDRRLTWQWPRSIPVSADTDIAGERFDWLEQGLGALKLPACVIWGREEEVFKAEVFAAKWHEIWPHAEGTHMVTGNHFLQEDSGSEIGELLTDFARRNFSKGVTR